MFGIFAALESDIIGLFSLIVMFLFEVLCAAGLDNLKQV